MPDINITVAHKVAVSDTQSIVCDNSDYTVHWTLDEEWAAYDTKTMRVIYMDGTFTDKVFNGDTIALPVCTVPGMVQIGLFAGDIRTSRVAIMRALPSVRSAAGAPADPTPDVYDQLMELIKGLGGVDPDVIAKAVADYLAAHPIEETDPTVPEWAKAEKKPTYTAAEVGAVAQTDLQAATDAALAQAKASGAFDGVPGKNGADGAPGIYYGTMQPTGDTHPVWIDPNGMPDELDLSLGVTGATVGQIAKIAAVDASGVPTAWSPVDMAEGEELRLIRTINVSSDDLNSIYFNVDDENRPFNLHRVVIAMYGAATNTGSKQAALFFRGGDKNLGDRAQGAYGIRVNSGEYNYMFGFVFEIYNVGGLWFGNFAHGRNVYGDMGCYVPESKSGDASITEIKLLWNALDVHFPNGGTIEFWGA